MGGGGGKSNGNAAQPSRLTMSRLEQVFYDGEDGMNYDQHDDDDDDTDGRKAMEAQPSPVD